MKAEAIVSSNRSRNQSSDNSDFRASGFNREKRSRIKKKRESKSHSRIFYAIIPTELIRCAEVSRGARLLYGLVHSYSKQKVWLDSPKGIRRPFAYVSKKRLAKNMNCSSRSIYTWLKELSAAGWVEIRRRKVKETNKIYLNCRPRRSGQK